VSRVRAERDPRRPAAPGPFGPRYPPLTTPHLDRHNHRIHQQPARSLASASTCPDQARPKEPPRQQYDDLDEATGERPAHSRAQKAELLHAIEQDRTRVRELTSKVKGHSPAPTRTQRERDFGMELGR
jgi:hypothetical protein